jgi:myo-inositol-1(or 4)-monophosphatase
MDQWICCGASTQARTIHAAINQVFVTKLEYYSSDLLKGLAAMQHSSKSAGDSPRMDGGGEDGGGPGAHPLRTSLGIGNGIMDDSDMEAFAAFADRLADHARAVTLGAAGTAPRADNKAGPGAFDPVTDADRGAEQAMRALIEAHWPDHGIAGEEFGLARGDARFVWSLDPIDGTRAFICGLPGWTTLIALLVDGAPVLGLVDAPRLDERYLGFAAGATLRHAGASIPIRASGCRALAEARLATTDPDLFEGPEAEAFGRLRRAARLTRYGFDAYAYARLAAGRIDLVAESGLKTHDWAALVPLIRAAGGTVGNWRGEAEFSAGQILAAATPELFEAAVETLGG